MHARQPTPAQDAVAVYAHRHSRRTMVQVVKAVCPDRSPCDARAAIRRAEWNGRAELRPNPRHKAATSSLRVRCPAMRRTALSRAGTREGSLLSGRLRLTRAEVKRLRAGIVPGTILPCTRTDEYSMRIPEGTSPSFSGPDSCVPCTSRRSRYDSPS